MLLLLEWPVTTTVTIEQEVRVKSREEIMNVLEAFDSDWVVAWRRLGCAGVVSSHVLFLALSLSETRVG